MALHVKVLLEIALQNLQPSVNSELKGPFDQIDIFHSSQIFNDRFKHNLPDQVLHKIVEMNLNTKSNTKQKRNNKL